MHQSPGIYLASSSPRRQELLRQIGVPFVLLPVDIDETRQPTESAQVYVQRLALEKARKGRQLLGSRADRPVLGADTAVVADDHIMGKPHDRQHGVEMLKALSGRTHRVLSAVALVGAREAVSVNTSLVTFRTITAAECEAYWDTGEPLDKAGGYAIQGRAAIFVSHLEGSYSGVMGLPLYETAGLLRQFEINII